MTRALALHADSDDDALLAALVITASLRRSGVRASVGTSSLDPVQHLLIETLFDTCHRLDASPRTDAEVLVTASRLPLGPRPGISVIPGADGTLRLGSGRIPRRPLPTLRHVTDLLTWRAGAASMVQRLASLAAHIAIDDLLRSAQPLPTAAPMPSPTFRVAVASDEAFTAPRPHLLHHLRCQGADLVPFSPLRHVALPDVDAIVLHAVAPELHASELATNDQLREALRGFTGPMLALGGAALYLGEGLYDLDGAAWAMVGCVADQWEQLERPTVGSAVSVDILGCQIRGSALHTSELLTAPEAELASDGRPIAWSDRDRTCSLLQPARPVWP